MVLQYILKTEGQARIMSPQDVAKLARDAMHKGAMLGYDSGMKMGVLLGSVASAIAGAIVLSLSSGTKKGAA